MATHAYALPPLQWDKERDEPFIELEHEGENHLLTMWRESDSDDMVRIWNHPLVGKWSFRRPYPFTHADLPTTFDMFLKPDRSPAVLDSFRDAVAQTGTVPTGARMILRGLRTAEGQLIGNIFIDPESGELGYDLDPEYGGRGLGTRMVDFAVQFAGVTGVKQLIARVATANRPSERILEKNGFERKSVQMGEMPEEKGGHMVEFGHWERDL